MDRGAEVVAAEGVLTACEDSCTYAGGALINAVHYHCPCGCGPTTQRRKNVKLCGACGRPCVRAEYKSRPQLWLCGSCRRKRPERR